MPKIAHSHLLIFLAVFVILAVASSGLVGYSQEIVIQYDSDGIPQACYGIQMGRDIGCHYYPLTVASEAKTYLNAYRMTRELKYLDKFNLRLDWLLEHRSVEGNVTFWRSDFPWPSASCKPGWPSGMTQGVVLTDLVGAYEITGNGTYLEIAESVMESFYVPYEDGGFLYEDSEGFWFAEYPCREKPPRVLNGFIFSLQGLNDYYNATENPRAKYLFDRGVENLEARLPGYDAYGWSYYDAKGHKATSLYHELHVKLMGEMYEITGNELYLEYKEKWTN